MGGAIKAISSVAQSFSGMMQGLSGGLLKNVVGNLFKTASSFLNVLSPIAPNFFKGLDSKLKSLEPKVEGAIDKGVAFAKNLANKGAEVASNFAKMGTQAQQVPLLQNLGF